MTQRVAFFDIAGTIIDANPWPYLLKHPDVSRGRTRMATLRFMPTWLGTKIHLVSDTTFRHRWINLMAGVFKGWSKDDTEALFNWVVSEPMRDCYRTDVVARLRQHKHDGDHVVLVSGMFGNLAAAFAKHVGADAALGSQLVFRDGICTGVLNGNTCIGPRKLTHIREYLIAHKLSPDLSDHYAYADSLSDLPLLSAVGTPVATYPDSALQAIAQERSWTVLPAQPI